MLATCCARIAGLFVLRVSLGLKGVVDRLLAAIDRLRIISCSGE